MAGGWEKFGAELLTPDPTPAESPDTPDDITQVVEVHDQTTAEAGEFETPAHHEKIRQPPGGSG